MLEHDKWRFLRGEFARDWAAGTGALWRWSMASGASSVEFAKNWGAEHEHCGAGTWQVEVPAWRVCQRLGCWSMTIAAPNGETIFPGYFFLRRLPFLPT